MTDFPQRRTRALVGGVAGAILFTLLTVLVHADPHWLRSLDHSLGSGPQRVTAEHAWLLDAAKTVAAVTQPDILVGLVLLLAGALALIGYWRAGVWALVVIEVSRWGYFGLKALLRRHRPEWPHPAVHIGGWSFPSGHSTAIAALAGIAIVLATLLCPSRRSRIAVTAAALLVAATVGLDRVLLGVHYPSDVLGGFVLGASVTLLGLAVFDPLPRTPRSARTSIAP